MKLATVKIGGEVKIAAVVGEKVIDLAAAYKKHYGVDYAPDFLYDMKKLISAGEPALRLVEELTAVGSPVVRDFQWLPPVPNPEKILCVAVNYRAHGVETGMEPPERPYFFPKFPNTLVGHRGVVLKHRVVERLDWEVELVVVIGRAGKYIKPQEALDYVFGYTVGVDITARDWQNPEEKTARLYGKNWIWGKSMDTMAPTGPYIVTKDEVPDPNRLALRLWVNEVLEQEGSTTDLIFKVQELVSWASQGITLKPGDLIFTGTPPGVGWAKGKYLKGGDVIQAEVEKVGRLVVYVVEE
ncbi:MAG: fumarylacetoacetate hydrolase family protein [Pyrobaculum sp.]